MNVGNPGGNNASFTVRGDDQLSTRHGQVSFEVCGLLLSGSADLDHQIGDFGLIDRQLVDMA